MKNLKENNILIIVRHGERIDKVGLEPTFHLNDPELTEMGKNQAYEIGQVLSDFLIKKFPNHLKIKINSSPFARTIQTSANLIRGLKKNHSIEDNLMINYHFSEIIIKEFYEHHNIDSFLVVKNDISKLEKDIIETNLNFINTYDHLKLTGFESGLNCQERLIKGLTELIKNQIEEKQKLIHIVISHGGPMDLLNNYLEYPGEPGWENIKYCNSFIYTIEDEENGRFRFNYVDSFFPSQ